MRQRKMRLFLPPVLLILLVCCMPVIVQAEWKSNVLSNVQLNTSPIDIFTTRDGRWAYVLTPGEVQVYAVNTQALSGRIPVDITVSRISASPNGDKLYLLNEKSKTLSTVSVAFFNMFTVTDSPSRGPANAPVVITDFSDYQ